MITFVYPIVFLLVFLPFVIRAILPAVKGIHGDALRFPLLKDVKDITQKSGKIWDVSLPLKNSFAKPVVWVFVIWGLLCVAAARPQWVGEPIRIKNYSRDILLVTDISTSMLARDFSINNYLVSRLTAVKQVINQFIEKRANDRIGLILYGTRAYLQAPITYDKKAVQDILMNVEAGMAGNSTAIGDALGLALKYLKDTPNKDKKVIILLTDGENNDGMLTMPEVMNLAKKEGVKIYTIGVGPKDNYLNSFMGISFALPDGLDEDSLKQLAKDTQGRYFRAEDTSDLLQVYAAIDQLEPDQNEDNFVQETKDLFYIPLLAAVVLGMILVAYIRRRG